MNRRRRGPRIRAGILATLVVVASAPPADAVPPRGDLRSPLGAVPAVATPFDPPAERWLRGHRGVDLAAEAGAVVRAPAAATVGFAGVVAGRPVLTLDHGGGLRTTYEPVDASVRAGDPVAAGNVVGRLLPGHPGCPVRVCLHWGAIVSVDGGVGRDAEAYVDPMSLLAPDDRPIRLKPLRTGDGGR